MKKTQNMSAESVIFAYQFPVIVPARVLPLWFVPLINEFTLITSYLAMGKISVKGWDYSGIK